MTVKELIEALSKLNEDYDVKVQYRDYGGEYCTDDEIWLEVRDYTKEVIL